MLSKFPKISKELLVTGLVLFAAINIRAVFSFTRAVVFAPLNIVYMLIAFIPFTIFILSMLSPNFRKELKAVDIVAIAVIMYMFTVVLDDTVMRYSILTGICFVTLSLLFGRNIYALPVVAVLNLVASFKLHYATVFSVPVSICISMVYFAYLFEKKKTKSGKKKSKKPEVAVPEFKKEKIIFAISELILFAALGVTTHSRFYTIALISFMSNLKYVIPILIPAVCFVIFAVIAIKNKKPVTHVIGYLVAVATMPLTQLCEYSTAAGGVITAFMLLLALLGPGFETAKYADNLYKKIVTKISKPQKSTEE